MAAAPESPRRRWLLITAVAAVPFVVLLLRFWFLCDDAYISFRYARNFAQGLGLTWDPADSPPVEGYSNLLWVLWLGCWDRLGIAPEHMAPVTSATCGVLLLGTVLRFLSARVRSTAALVAAAAFLVLLPPLSVWSTSGLEVMPAALLGFTAFTCLFGDPLQAHGIRAGLAALASCMLRPETPVFAALYLAVMLILWLRRGGTAALGRGIAAFALVMLFGLSALYLFRLGYHGDLLAQTVQQKGGFAWFRIVRGLDYLGSFLLTFPGVPLAVLMGIAAARTGSPQRRLLWLCLLPILAQAAFSIRVGGDFMAMGRFLVPALPFATVMFGFACDRLTLPWGRERTIALATLCVLVNLPPAFDLHVFPRAIRDLCHFRWGRPLEETEFVVWQQLRDGVRDDEILARALNKHTRPGEQLIREAIGVVGYRTHLRVIDTFGLVTRMPESDFTWEPGTTPGHDRYLPWTVFLPRRPEYVNAQLAAPDEPLQYPMLQTPFEGSALHAMVEPLRLPVDEPDVLGRKVELRLLRFLHWDDPTAPLAPLLAAINGVDPADPAALSRLNERANVNARQQVTQSLLSLLDQRRIAQHGAGPFRYSRIADASSRTHGFRIECTLQEGDGIGQDLSRGKFVFAVAISGSPRIGGAAPGWIVVPPAKSHRDTVTGGSALLVHFIPGNAIAWGR